VGPQPQVKAVLPENQRPKPENLPKPPEKIEPIVKKLFVQNDEFIILTTEKGDSLRSLAEKYLGNPDKYWQIGDFNGIDEITPGEEVVIPLVSQNPIGVFPGKAQTIPILCYHQFGDKKAKMVVSSENFDEQMAYLKNNGYRVIPMSALLGFLKASEPLPRKAVIITIDDGYKSIYDAAYPILKKYAFPATVFIYTDFLNARRGLTWEQMREMTASGLIDIQPHSKTHSNMGVMKIGEKPDEYEQRILTELEYPKKRIDKSLGLPVHTFAYPYGDANKEVIEKAGEFGYSMGVTVQTGGNAFYGDRFLLKRTMVFGEDDLNAFIKKLEVSESVPSS